MLQLEEETRSSVRAGQSIRLAGNFQASMIVAHPYFRWDIPSENLEVLLHLNVVELVEATTNRAGIGCAAGVLLGRVEENKQTRIVIEGLEAATPEGGALESPFKDRQAVTAFLDRVQSRSGRLSTMGFYRSCGREGAALNPDDLDMLTRSIASPRAAVVSTGVSDGGGARPKVEPAARAAQPKNAERLFLMIEPRGTRGANASIYLSRMGMVLLQSPRLPLHRTDLARIGSICQTPGSGIREVSVPVVPAPAISKAEKASKRPMAAVAVIAAVALISMFGLNGFQGFGTQSTRAEINYDQPIGLQAEKKGTDWQIRWNKNSYALRQAKKTRVEIEDGLIHKDFEPSPAELVSGTILYSPETDNVVLTMKTEAERPEKSFRETVRLISALVPEPANEALLTASPSLLAKKLKGRTSPIVRTAAPKRSKKESSLPAEEAMEASTSKTALNTTHESEAASKEDESGTTGATVQDPPTLSVLSAEAPIAKGYEVPHAASEGAQPPELVSRKNPVYPEQAKAKHVEGTVEVGFRITSDGDVENVKILSGDPMLAEATVQAVRGWKYKPARLGGLPTEVSGHVVVKFSLK